MSVPGTLLFQHDTTETITRPELWQSLTMRDFFFFLEGGGVLKVYSLEGHGLWLKNRNEVELGFVMQLHKALMASQEPLMQARDHRGRPWAASLHHLLLSFSCLPP